jgi:hypothetical protein
MYQLFYSGLVDVKDADGVAWWQLGLEILCHLKPLFGEGIVSMVFTYEAEAVEV